MATYYVRMSGSDSNAGTSSSTAWRTLGKALGATGISSGDTVYVGAGTYREQLTVNLTPSAETKIIGDILGTQTGDAGEVIFSIFKRGDYGISLVEISGTQKSIIDLNAKSYLTFENLIFISNTAGGNAQCIDALTRTSTNITFRNCSFFSTGSIAMISASAATPTALDWTITGCRFCGTDDSIYINPLSAASGSDWDLKVTISNCFAVTPGGIFVRIAPSGTQTIAKGNGVTISNCTVLATTGIQLTSGTSLSTTYPSTIKSSFFMTNTIVTATTTSHVTDGGGNRLIGSTVNFTVSGTSRSGTSGGPNTFPLEMGQSALLGRPYKHPLQPYSSSGTTNTVLGFSPAQVSTDLLGLTRPVGSTTLADQGTASSATSTTLVDSSKTWSTDEHVGKLVYISSGTGSSQVKRIKSNTSTTLTISGGTQASSAFYSGQWATTPDSTSTYIIYSGPLAETGKATTAGTPTTLTDANAYWETNQWRGFSVAFDSQTSTVSSNTATVLTFTAVANAPTSSSTYSLYYPGGSLTTSLSATGALESSDTGLQDTVIYDQPPSSLRLDGPSLHQFRVPVSTKATTIRIRGRYDTYYGAATKPSLSVLDNSALGVSATTATMTASADTFETLAVSFTPTTDGYVTIRLLSSTASPFGRAWFDTYSID